jgi:hypothetical protein
MISSILVNIQVFEPLDYTRDNPIYNLNQGSSNACIGFANAPAL